MRCPISRLSGSYVGRTDPLSARLRRISPLERSEEARAFLDLFAQQTDMPKSSLRQRWADISRSLRRTGSYTHTPEELAFGARVAWRNNGHCIGRLFWESLEVVDARDALRPEEMAEQIVRHMTRALGDGRIRSVITIFAPVQGDTIPAYVESPQITQYAGYARPDGTVMGDRQSIEATRIAQSLGWRAPDEPGPFDRLPFCIRDAEGRRVIFDCPDSAWRDIPIRHPRHAGLGGLGLRWYAVPCVSNMILTIGGIDYPCAPFNGFYMGTEIASRNFADRGRYDLLPKVASAIGVGTDEPLWQDVALTELNRAILHSYREDGVTILDHHRASDEFMQFRQKEESNGRRVAADWRWIVPPQASAATEVFHLKMRNFHPVPNFYRSRGDDGLQLMPFYGDLERNRASRSLDRILRRWKIWKRMAW